MLKIHVGDTTSELTEVDFQKLAQQTDGASARDVKALVTDALNEPIDEAQRANYFRQVGDMYTAVSGCEHCPQAPSACLQCGAVKMDLDDVPDDKLISRNVLMKDFEMHLSASYHKLSADKLQRYRDWEGTQGTRHSNQSRVLIKIE